MDIHALAEVEDIGAQAQLREQPGFKVAEARVVGAAGHVKAKVGDPVGVYLPLKTFRVDVDVVGGVKGFLLDWVQVSAH